MNATVCLNDGDTHNAPVEATEAKNPIIVEHRALRQDSGGAGKFRGGLGVSNEVRMRRAATIHAHVERTICAPWGLHGGKDALANRIFITREDGKVKRFPTGKINPTEIDKGDGFTVETAGGGGFWSPLGTTRGTRSRRRALRLRVVGSGPGRLRRGDSPAGTPLRSLTSRRLRGAAAIPLGNREKPNCTTKDAKSTKFKNLDDHESFVAFVISVVEKYFVEW